MAGGPNGWTVQKLPGAPGSVQGSALGDARGEESKPNPQGKIHSAQGLLPEQTQSQKPRVEGG